MSDLTDFLLARIEGDEELAASGWHKLPEGRWTRTNDGRIVLSPDAILADCKVKRQIVEGADVIRGGHKGYTQRMEHADAEDANYVIATDILRSLASLYADHPEYRDEWSL